MKSTFDLFHNDHYELYEFYDHYEEFEDAKPLQLFTLKFVEFEIC